QSRDSPHTLRQLKGWNYDYDSIYRLGDVASSDPITSWGTKRLRSSPLRGNLMNCVERRAFSLRCWLVGRHLLLCRRFLRLVLCLVFILPGLLFSLVHLCFEIILRHFRTEVAKGVM